MVIEIITVWVRDLVCQLGLVEIVFGEYNMNKIIKDCIIGTTIITSVVLFLAAAVISIYKAFGY